MAVRMLLISIEKEDDFCQVKFWLLNHAYLSDGLRMKTNSSIYMKGCSITKISSRSRKKFQK